MKKNLIFSLMVFSVILMNSCTKDDDNTDPIGNDGTEETIKKSIFRVVYEQEGELKYFTKNMGISENFIYTDTKEDVGPDIIKLTEKKYSFINKVPVEEIEFSLSIGWVSLENLDAKMTSVVKVFRDTVLIDEQSFVCTIDTNVVESFNYKAPGNE